MGRVRLASVVDVPDLMELVIKYHSEKSNIKDVPVDRNTLFNSINYYIATARHVVFVYTADDKIKGFIMGSLEPFPHNDRQYWAADTMFIAEAGGAYLLKRFLAWAKAMKAKRVYMAVSTGDASADALYQALGMEYTGGMYRVVY